MVKYKVTVSTAGTTMAFTTNSVFIKLVGREGESKRTKLTSIIGAVIGAVDFFQGTASTFSVDCPISLGDLVLIELEKKALLMSVDWFPTKIEIESPEGDIYHFPIYRLITNGQTHLFKEAKALRHFEDEHPLSKLCREKELEKRVKDYPWDIAEEGIPHCMKACNALDLPYEVRFTFTKSTEFLFTLSTGLAELNLKGLANSKDTWKTINDIAYVKSTDISDYVREHWKEDAFFGYQYLNGVNPILIRHCTALPDNFPVTNDMLSIHGGRSLEEEMKNGNMFLLDYKNLDGVEANIIDGKQQYLMAPLVLLHLTPGRKLRPIAIQLKQKPSEDNPIFLPTDSEYDWLMAKIYVRSADFSDHQLNFHLLRTHLLAEVFTLSLLRNVPMVHPLYKLLIPHTRFTLQINNLARGFLISKKGFFNNYAASGGKAMKTILQRSTASLTYSSLCPPDDIKERGMDSVPGYYYRDDALKLWAIIHRFVEGILGYYYHTDAEVQKDSELQTWIKDIFFHGFLAEASTGVPQSLSSVGELVKFVTMVIFTGSVQHSAANSGQFDYGGWMPNTPITLRCPPPTTKGSSSQSSMLEALPDVAATANGLSTMWLLSKQSSDFHPLGHYKEEHFREDIPCKFVLEFKTELAEFGAAVNTRNQTLEVPYTYMDPQLVENSVAV